MEKIFGNATRIVSEKEYNLLKAHLNELIDAATADGCLAETGADNEFTREIARLGKLGALYETEVLRLPRRTRRNHFEEEVLETELFEFA